MLYKERKGAEPDLKGGCGWDVSSDDMTVEAELPKRGERPFKENFALRKKLAGM